VRNPAAPSREIISTRPLGSVARRGPGTLPTLLDTRVVRAELARLRAPRPGTPLSTRLEVRSTWPAAGSRERA